MSTIALSARPDRAGGHDRAVALWLFACAAMVLAMVVIGGVTRLTESGLSIVEWEPLVGWIPPLSHADWVVLFEKYRASPQYRLVNQGMDLADFRNIFWWEYVHRLWGRLIGLAFLLPLLVFWARGWLTRAMRGRLVLLFVLGGLQGALGWYMVQSGLVDRPSVSHYRLTAHLGLAIVIFAALLWMAFDLAAPRAGRPSRAALALAGLVFLTICAGGMLAGLDAGFVYNTFPRMNGEWLAAEATRLSPWWLNHLENPAMVQFQHRILGLATVAAASLYWWRMRDRDPLAAALVALAALAQAALGIATLVLVVPIPLAAAHQGGAVLLLTAVLWAAHVLRGPRP